MAQTIAQSRCRRGKDGDDSSAISHVWRGSDISPPAAFPLAIVILFSLSHAAAARFPLLGLISRLPTLILNPPAPSHLPPTHCRPSARLILNYLVPCSLTFAAYPPLSFKSSPLRSLINLRVVNHFLSFASGNLSLFPHVEIKMLGFAVAE